MCAQEHHQRGQNAACVQTRKGSEQKAREHIWEDNNGHILDVHGFGSLTAFGWKSILRRSPADTAGTRDTHGVPLEVFWMFHGRLACHSARSIFMLILLEFLLVLAFLLVVGILYYKLTIFSSLKGVLSVRYDNKQV